MVFSFKFLQAFGLTSYITHIWNNKKNTENRWPLSIFHSILLLFKYIQFVQLVIHKIAINLYRISSIMQINHELPVKIDYKLQGCHRNMCLFLIMDQMLNFENRFDRQFSDSYKSLLDLFIEYNFSSPFIEHCVLLTGSKQVKKKSITGLIKLNIYYTY